MEHTTRSMPEPAGARLHRGHRVLTVQSSVSTDAMRGEEDNEGPGKAPSCLTVTLKWIVVVLLAASFTFTLVVSKMSLVYLCGKLTPVRQNLSSLSSVERASGTPETVFVLLVLVLLLPVLSTLIRSIWCGGFRRDRPWPSAYALAVGTCAAVLESVGLPLFVLVVVTESTCYMSVLLMSGVFLIHIFYYVLQYCRSWASHACLAVVFIFALVCELLGMSITGLFQMLSQVHTPANYWAVPVSLLVLSIAWCPSIQKAQLIPHLPNSAVQRRNRPIPRFSTEDSVTSSSPSEASTYTTLPPAPYSQVPASTPSQNLEDPTQLFSSKPEYSARWKISIVTSCIKLILIPAFSILFAYLLKLIQLQHLLDGFSSLGHLQHPLLVSFLVHVCASLAGNLLGWMACVVCVEKLAFALPLMLATPVTFCTLYSLDAIFDSSADVKNLRFVIPAGACLYAAQILSTGFFVFTSQTIAMQKESMIFWLPGYNSVFLEQWFLLTRKTRQTDLLQDDPAEKAKKTRVYICTTMYREAPHEMEQLLRSLAAVNRATQSNERRFSSHIFFDSGIRDRSLTDFSVQLVSAVKKIFGVSLEECIKMRTPYGMRLTWTLPSVMRGTQGMGFHIHLKDSVKVKNKKRWSQVMYMSYVLDYHIPECQTATDEDTYILTTDADVRFGPESVEALLDLMSRDHTVGAVCARTFPLGSGPIVWYQVFDYAIGHWFQKAAEHVMGSVLCCPGCFSVFRAAALRQVLSIYASPVTQASEFLTKDMGEDRWLCTLLVQNGWRLEYCAAADNATFCPDDFDEFFKQRRRWTPSTLANQLLLIQQWKLVSKFNQHISWVFLVYQAALLFSTLISPSMCVLIISGGLYYSWGVNSVLSTFLILTVLIIFMIICLNAAQDTQLKAARFLTMVFSLIMAAVVIGTATQIVDELQPHDTPNITTPAPTPPTPPSNITHALLLVIPQPPTSSPQIYLPASASTLYLAGLVGLFVMAALLHLTEAYCLLFGVVYLLCLPSGYLLLIIYSLCNITDRSWGTREGKSRTSHSNSQPWYTFVVLTFKKVFPCCFNLADPSHDKCVQTSGPPSLVTSAHHDHLNDAANNTGHRPNKVNLERSGSFKFHYERQDTEAIPVDEWMPRDFKDMYAGKFVTHGYDDTSLIAGMTDRDLKAVGITIKGHRKALLEEIKTLPDPDIQPNVPDTVEEWLDAVGLEQYRHNFRTLHIFQAADLHVLKDMTPADLARELRINKAGHFKRLMLAIDRLRHPTEEEREVSMVRCEIEAVPSRHLVDENPRECEFWELLRQKKLLPDKSAFAHDQELKEKLTSLRNSTLLVFNVSNLLWIILIMTLISKSQLNVLGTNALGLCFLLVFGVIVVIQFACLLVHRVATWLHLTARAPNCCGAPYTQSWAFNDSNLENSICVRSSDLSESADTVIHQNREIARTAVTTERETLHDERKPLLSRKKRSVNVLSSPEEDTDS